MSGRMADRQQSHNNTRDTQNSAREVVNPTPADPLIENTDKRPELQVAAALRDLRRAMAAANLRARVYGEDVDLRTIDTIDVLSAHGGLRVRELATALRVEQSTATRAVDRLEALGLAARADVEDDGRGVLVLLTAAGNDQHALFRRRRLELFERLLESFSRVEKERLVDSLDRLVAELDRRTDEGIDLSRPTP